MITPELPWPSMRLRFSRCIKAIAAVSLLAACTEHTVGGPSVTPRGIGSRPAAAQLQAEDDLHPYERDARMIASATPSFGGIAFDTVRGLAVALTTNPNDSAVVRAAVEAVTVAIRATARSRGQRGDVVVRTAEFRFADLAEWRDSLLLWREGIGAGVRSLDVDEERNRIVVGISKARFMTAAGPIHRRMARIGGNLKALSLEVVDEIARTSAPRETGGGRDQGDSLASLIRPLRGGVGATGNDACTLGFIVKFDDVFYATMAAHCSKPAASVFPLSLQQGGQLAGVEAIDPGPYAFYSPEWHYARWSESTLYRIDDTVSFDFGRVARPENADGSLRIDSANPYFQITAEEPGGIANGWYVLHVGRTTGWHYGYVTKSCKDDYIAEDGYWLHCTFTASMPADHGDSGGPVLAPYNGGWMTVGMVFGKTTNDGWGVFTGWRGLDRDLTGSFSSGRLFSK